jgi:two-component system, sensor histidine kinase and response regulator
MSSEGIKKPVILIVDDTSENIDILKEALLDSYTIRPAPNGKIALKAAKIKPYPDLVLLDIMMPEMDGYEVYHKLKSSKESQNIPVIFVTAKSEEVSELKGLRMGAVDYITKPLSIPIVQARVKTQLTIYLQKQQLEKQYLLLKEAAQLREDVERIMRHDLKSPLAAIIGFAQLLAKPKVALEKLPEYAKHIESASYRLINMINTSLDLYKLEEGRYSFNPGRVDLLRIIDQLHDEFKPLLLAKKSTLIIQAPENEELIIQGEGLLCHSLFSNLIKNAMEASPRDCPIEVTLTKKNAVIQVVIHNTGTVPKPIREHFFEKFVTSGKRSGTGLGTYSAYLIAQLHQADISMKTSEDSGTVLTIQFPITLKNSETQKSHFHTN